MPSAVRAAVRALAGAALAVLLALAPGAAAAMGESGTFVGPSDVDATQAFAGGFPCVLGPAGAGTCLAFLDVDGDGAHDTGETAYLDLDGDAVVDRFEPRLTPLGSLPAFGQVRPADPDSGEALTLPPAAQLAFYDDGGNAAWSREDSFYGDMDGNGRVTPGDVRLAGPDGFAAGTRVATGDADERRILTVPAAPPTLAFTDFDGSTGFNLGDGLFADQDGAAPVAAVVFPEDLRLSRVGGLPPGRVVLPADADVTPILQALPGAPTFGFGDESGNGAFDEGEAFYLFDLADADGLLDPGDLRLTARFGQAAGHLVRPTDPDAGLAIPPAAQRSFVGPAGTTALAFYDSEGDASWSVADWVYVDADGSASVSPGDVRLTATAGGAAGTRVLSIDADENRPLVSAATGFGGALGAGNLGFLDADNSGAFNVEDTLYLQQAAASATPRAEDLRLSALDAARGPGTFVTVRDPDQAVTVAGPAAGVFAFLDENGNGAFDDGEEMFLDGLAGAAGAVSLGDLVVSPGASGDAPGRQVAGSDPRVGSALAAVGGVASVLLYDTDGDSFWSVTDRLVLDTDGNGLVSAGDVRLTAQDGQPPGSRVRSGAPDEGRSLSAVAGLALAVHDADASGAPLYTLCDQVYLTFGAAPGAVAVEDFRLGGHAAQCPPPAAALPSPSGPGSSSGPASSPSPSASSSGPGPTGASSSGPGGDGGDGGNGGGGDGDGGAGPDSGGETPVPAAGWVSLAALLAALALRGRRARRLL